MATPAKDFGPIRDDYAFFEEHSTEATADLAGYRALLERTGLLEAGTVTVRLPVVGDGIAAELTELCQDEPLGCPRDLNGDGVLTGGSRAEDHRVLPVEVRAEWGTGNPRQRVSLRTVRANL